MTKKQILLFVVSALIMTMLSSCSIGGQGIGGDNVAGDGSGGDDFSGDSGSGDAVNGDTSNNENVIYDNATKVTIVYNDTDIDREILEGISSSLTNVGSPMPSISYGDDEARQHEIVLGPTDRSISVKAYELLNRYKMRSESDGSLFYLIYTDGSSVAIAYDEHKLFGNLALKQGCEYLVDNIIDDNTTLSLPAGTVCKAAVDPIEATRELDAIQLEEEWSSLSTALEGYGNAEEVISALQVYYKLFTPELLLWYADLYDPTTGGFYYSNSARNTEGFLPDIETTNQVMTFLRNSKMTDNPYSVMSEEMKAAMTRFVKERQKPDGYFYHPQWEGMTYTFERLSRDLNWATSILKGLGATPTYTTPLGWRGEMNNTSVSPVSTFSITARISADSSTAVAILTRSNVVSTSSLSDMFASEASFREYLDSLDLLSNSYEVGNLIASLSQRVKSEGYTDILVDWLDSQQNSENGLWYYKTPSDEGYSIYSGVNGLFKISAAYNTLERPIPNPEQAINSAIEAITTEETPATVCYFYNTWCSVYNVSYNVRTYSELKGEAAEKLIASVQSRLIENAPEAIYATIEKALMFRKADGSYSMQPRYTAANAAGMPVALPNTNEGDVNATNIAGVSVITNMCAALGLPKVSIYTKADLYTFMLRIESLGEIIKNDAFFESPITFDSADELPLGVSSNVFEEGYVEIKENEEHGSNVLEFYTQHDELHKNQSNLRFQITESDESDEFEALAFEAELCFTPGEGRGSAMHYFTFCSSAGTKFQVLFMSDTNNNVTISQNLVGVSTGEWFKLRLEYFGKTVRDGSQVATVRVYVNGEYKFDLTTSNEKYITPVTSELNAVSIDYSSDNNRYCSLMLDNVVLKQGKLLEDRTNAEDFAERISFEYSTDSSLPQTVSSSLYGESTVTVRELERGGTATRALLLSAVPGGGSNLTFEIMNITEAYTAVALDTEIYFESHSDSTRSLYYYPEFRSRSGAVMSVTTRSYGGNVEMYIGGAWRKLGSTDSWHRLHLEFYLDDGASAMRIFFDGEYVADLFSAKTTSPSEISSVRFSYSGDNKLMGRVYFDELSVYRTELTELPKNDVDENGVYTFDSADASKLPNGVTFTEGGVNADSYAEVTDIGDGRGGVLAFNNKVDNAGASSSNTKSSVLFAVTEPISESLLFSLDFKVDDTQGDLLDGMVEDGSAKVKYPSSAQYRLRALNASGQEVFRLHYSIDKYGEASLGMVSSGGAVVSKLSLPGGTYAVGNWISLTLRAYNVESDGEISTVIAVTAVGYNKARNELVTKSTEFDLSSAGYSACDLSAITAIGFQRYDAGVLDSTLYFDNVLITENKDN